MPSITDLANSVRRPINKAVEYDKKDMTDESAVCYATASSRALSMAWLHESDETKKEEILAAQETVSKLYSNDTKSALGLINI